MHTTTITFEGLDFEVTYTYRAGDFSIDPETPPVDPHVEIEKMEHNGNDCTEVMAEFADMVTVEELVYQAHINR